MDPAETKTSLYFGLTPFLGLLLSGWAPETPFNSRRKAQYVSIALPLPGLCWDILSPSQLFVCLTFPWRPHHGRNCFPLWTYYDLNSGPTDCDGVCLQSVVCLAVKERPQCWEASVKVVRGRSDSGGDVS